MSQYIGEAYVKILPDSRGFAAQVNKDVSAATRAAGTTGGRRPRDELLDMAAATKRTREETERWLVTQRAASAEQARMGGSTARTAIGFAVLGIATRNLAQDFSKWAETQSTVVQGLGEIAKGVTNLDLVTTGKGIANFFAGLNLRGEGAAKAAAEAATKRDLENQNAIKIAGQLLDLREKAAKAEGQVGTAAGRTRYQLERQRDAAQNAFNALTADQRRIAGAQFGLNQNLGTNQRLAGRNPVSVTDKDRSSEFELQTLRAAQTKNLADDRKLITDRRDFLRKQISYLETAGANTQAAKDRLKTLYGQLDTVEGQIATAEEAARQKRQERLQNRLTLAEADLSIEAANARSEGAANAALLHRAEFAKATAQNKNLSLQERKQFEVEAAQAEQQIYQNGVQAAERAKADRERALAEQKRLAAEAKQKAEEELQARRTAYRADISLAEQRLGLNVTRAQLTEKNLNDDRKAIKAQIAFYRKQANDLKLTDSERLGFRSQQLNAQLSLKSLNQGQNQAPRSSASDFFREAASQFRSFGSNIATSGGILSGQDARASFAARALSGTGIRDAKAAQAQQTRNAALAEAQKQTSLLKTIANRLTYGGAQRDPPAKGIANARRGAHTVSPAV